MGSEPLRTLVCAPPGAVRQAITRMVTTGDHFVLAGSTAVGSEVAALVRSLQPDVLTLDIELVGADALSLVHGLALEAGVATLLLVDEHQIVPADIELERKLRVFRLSKHRLCSADPVDQSFARTRLHLVAARRREPRSTAEPGELTDVLKHLRRSERATADTALRGLVAAPLDLAIVALDATHAGLMHQVISNLEALIVPTLVASEDPAVAQGVAHAAHARGLPFVVLEGPNSLRRVNGLLVGRADTRILVQREGIWVGAGKLSLPELVRSASVLAGSVLIIGASHRPEVVGAVTHATVAGANVCVLDPPLSYAGAEGVVPATRESLAWILRSGVVPRRI